MSLREELSSFRDEFVGASSSIATISGLLLTPRQFCTTGEFGERTVDEVVGTRVIAGLELRVDFSSPRRERNVATLLLHLFPQPFPFERKTRKGPLHGIQRIE